MSGKSEVRMKALLTATFIFTAALSNAAAAIGIGVIGGGGGGESVEPISATVFATDQVTLSGQALNAPDLVKIEIETPGNEDVATFSVTPDAFGNFSVIWYPPTDATFTIKATTYQFGIQLSSQSVGILSAVRPDASGHITGGGWYSLNGGKDTMGFVAQVLGNGSVRGNFEFQDHAGLKNFKSTSVDWVYAPNPTEGYFSGYCKLNGAGNYRFFVHVFDNGEPGVADSVDFSVHNPTTGAAVFAYGKTLSKGNVQVHSR